MLWSRKILERDIDLLELQKTIALLQLLSLNLKETADNMEVQVEEMFKERTG